MSVLAASGAVNGLKATTNLSNPVSCTKLIWAKWSATPTSYSPFLSTTNGAITNYSELYGGDTSGLLGIHSNTTDSAFSSQPTWANWNCYLMTATAAGAGSLVGFWQDNAGGGFVSKSTTGVSFTAGNDALTGIQTQGFGITLAYYMEWSVVLSGTDMNTQFLSKTPVVQLGSLRRYLALTNAASAATDTSGNGFNMTVQGTLADGASLPTFPTGVLFRKTLSRIGGRIGARQLQA